MELKCPICDKKTEVGDSKAKNIYFPFCSERCKLVDLGAWLDEEYNIPDTHNDQDIDDADNY